MALEEKQDTTMDVAVKTVREYAVHCLVKMPVRHPCAPNPPLQLSVRLPG